ncbi:MAG: glycosyltransferase, partial [Desulfobulbaceae bacterium]|nr:glycosyltransferase [Desulfobulbaceae bacterium]
SAVMHDDSRIIGHGFVRDLDQVWQEVDLMIQPISCGAGINIKVAESLYNRMPIIATPLAVRGISLHDDPAIKILAEAHEWINYLNGPEPAKHALLTARQENADLFCMAKNSATLQQLLKGDTSWPQ